MIGNSSDDYYLRARVNPRNSEYLDVVLEGVANGWVAVGFSINQTMVCFQVDEFILNF